MDEASEQFELLNPALKKLEKAKKKRQQKLLEHKFAEVNVNDDGEDNEVRD